MKALIPVKLSLSLLLVSPLAFCGQDDVPLFISGQKDRLNNPDPESGGTRRLLSYIEKETGVKFDKKFVPWKRALQSAVDGNGIVFGASKTPDREEKLQFSAPLYSDNVWLITRCDARISYSSVNDLKGKTIGLIRESDYGPEIAFGAEKIFKAEYDTNDSVARFQKLLAGRTDAVLVYSQLREAHLLESFLQRQYGALFEKERDLKKDGAFCAAPTIVHSSTVHFAAKIGYRVDFFEALNATIRKARNSGNLSKWFSYPMEY